MRKPFQGRQNKRRDQKKLEEGQERPAPKKAKKRMAPFKIGRACEQKPQGEKKPEQGPRVFFNLRCHGSIAPCYPRGQALSDCLSPEAAIYSEKPELKDKEQNRKNRTDRVDRNCVGNEIGVDHKDHTDHQGLEVRLLLPVNKRRKADASENNRGENVCKTHKTTPPEKTTLTPYDFHDVIPECFCRGSSPGFPLSRE
jgi:hypothetical protein